MTSSLVFDPTWLEQTEKHIRQFRGAINMKKVDTLWLIDDRLQRDPELEGMRLQMSIDLRGKEFFNAMGRRFVEVHACDPGWGVVAAESDGAGHEAFD